MVADDPTTAEAPLSVVLGVSGMTCSTCSAAVEDVVSKVCNTGSQANHTAYHRKCFTAMYAKCALHSHCDHKLDCCHHAPLVLLPAVRQVPGVVSVVVNLASNSAKVVYDPHVTGPRSCIDAIEDAGEGAGTGQCLEHIHACEAPI